MAVDLVKKALKTATTPNNAATRRKAKAKAVKIKDAIAAAKKTRSGLFGIEKQSAGLLDEQIKSLEGDLAIATAQAKRTSNYPLLSFEPLSWRDSKGYPKLVLFSLDSPRVSFSIRSHDSYGSPARHYSPALPKPLLTHYEDVFQALIKRNNGYGVEITAEYNGILPEETRAKIVKAKSSKEFQQIFVLAEVAIWKEREVQAPRPADPLVLGWDGTALWVIDAFDLTPAENYVKSEFTV